MISDDEVKDKSPSPADSDMGIQQWISALFEINYLSGWSLDVVSGWTRLCSSDVCSGRCQSDKSGREAEEAGCEAQEAIEEEKKAVRRKSVGCIPSRSWMGVMLDTVFIFNLTFFVHIFERNPTFKNEYTV